MVFDLSFLIFFTLYACVNIYIQFERSENRQYPSLIQSFYDQRCKKGVWLKDEARVQYVSTVLFLFILVYFILIYIIFFFYFNLYYLFILFYFYFILILSFFSTT